MLFALLSLFVLFFLIRLIIGAVATFFAWLGRGKKIHELVDEHHVEAAYAESIRSYVRELDDRRSLKRLGKEVTGQAPKLTREQKRALRAASWHARDAYLSYLKLSWYQIVIIFLVGSFLGLIIEEIWMFATEGLTESRVGLVWGPYSPIYGFGAVLLTLVCWKLRKQGARSWQVFVVGMIVGVPLFAVIYDVIKKLVFHGLRRNGQLDQMTVYHDEFGDPGDPAPAPVEDEGTETEIVIDSGEE